MKYRRFPHDGRKDCPYQCAGQKSKTAGLTETEKAEQQALRQEYLADIKASLRSQLERTSIQEPDGTIHKVTRRTDLTGERS